MTKRLLVINVVYAIVDTLLFATPLPLQQTLPYY